MKNWIQVSLDNQALQDIDPAIVVLDVVENDPAFTVASNVNAKYNGSMFFESYRTELSVTITVYIHERRMLRKSLIVQKIQQWAQNGGKLRVGHRRGQFLDCKLSRPVGAGSAWQWSEAVQIVFTAYAVPYWQDEQVTTAASTASAQTHSFSITPPGTADHCRMSFEATAVEAMTQLEVKNTLNGSKIAFTGLSVPVGGIIKAEYKDGFLGLFLGNESIMGKRTADSTDDIILQQRKSNTIEATANGAFTIICTAKGLYL